MVRSNTLVPSQSVLRDVGFVTGGAALTALAAQVTVPWFPVPFTLQTLSVMVCGLSLGARRGAASQLLYLCAGASYLPVFAGGAGGFPYLLSKTGGYLWSFVLVAALLGWLAEKGWDRKAPTCAAALAIGIAINLLLGALWLSAFIGMKAAWLFGVAPFVGIEATKAVLAAVSVPALRKVGSLR